jgi:hypothetical protein
VIDKVSLFTPDQRERHWFFSFFFSRHFLSCASPPAHLLSTPQNYITSQFSNPNDLPLHGGVRYATGGSGPTDYPRINEAAWKKLAGRTAAGRRGGGAGSGGGAGAGAITGAVRELLLVDALRGVTPIVSWDDALVGDGTPGEIGLALHQLLKEDRRPPGPGERPLGEAEGVESSSSGGGALVGEEGSLRLPLHVHVPYGYLTGMMDELV